MAEERRESEKAELLFSINAFDQPAECSTAQAWGNLITNLMFMVPGTIPSDPEMGLDIAQYQFSYLEETIDTLEELIQEQVETYLPDIPLQSISLRSGEEEGSPNTLLITMTFEVDDPNDNIVVVAAQKSNSIINFAVV